MLYSRSDKLVDFGLEFVKYYFLSIWYNVYGRYIAK